MLAVWAEFDGMNGAFRSVECVARTTFQQVEHLKGPLFWAGNQIVARRMEREAVDGTVVNFVQLKNFAHPRLVNLDDPVG